MAEDPKIDPQKLNRDWEQFIQNEDLNHRLDSPEEAQSYAQQIDQVLTDQTTFGPWAEKYGEENLKAWGTVFKWFGEAGHFQLASKWKEDAHQVKNYLKGAHLYEEPTVDILDSAVPSTPGYHFGTSQTSARYYNQPLSVDVETKIFELCEAAGSGEKAIGFIKELKKAYPEQFNAGGGLASEHVPFFDGRKPLQLARGISVTSQLLKDPNSLVFLKRVDDTLGWKFTFQTANTYLRFHQMWQKEGEAFFAKLKMRAEINNFAKTNQVESEIDEAITQKITTLDPKVSASLFHIIQESGISHFFVIYGSKQYNPPANEGQEFENGSPSERLNTFIDILQTRGPDFFKEVHNLAGFPEKISLDYLPLYSLADKLVAAGEKSENKSISWKNILLELKGALISGPGSKAQGRYISKSWYAASYATSLGDMDIFRLRHQAQEQLLTSLAQIFVFLESQGQLEETIKNSDLSVLALCGAHIDEKGMLGETHFTNLDELKNKLFWAKAALQRSAHSHDNWKLNESEMSSFFWSLSGVYYPSILSEKIPPRPSDADLQRLNQWTQRLSQTQLLKESPAHIQFLLWQGILWSNKKVPSDEEFKKIETTILENQIHLKTASLKGYALLLHLCHVTNLLWDRAPTASRLINNAFAKEFEASGRIADVLKTSLALESQFSGKMIELEQQINQHLNDPDLTLPRLAFEDIHTFEGYKTSSFGATIDQYIRILGMPHTQVSSFLKAFETAGKREVSFSHFSGFEALYNFYQREGEQALQQLLAQWETVGLDFRKYYGDGDFLNLSANDLQRLHEAKATIDFSKTDGFLNAKHVLNLDRDHYTHWQTVTAQAQEKNISPEVSLLLAGIPNGMELIDLLLSEGILRDDGTHSPDERIQIYIKDAIPLLAENLGTTRMVLEKLKNSFGSYNQFTMKDEFKSMGGVVLSGDAAIIGHLARIVAFEAKMKDSFFDKNKNGPDLIVWGQNPNTALHPMVHDGEAFNPLDYSFWMYGATARTYPQITDGRTKQQIVEELLIQFTGLEISQRKSDKSYAGLESVSRPSLNELPLSKLLKIQWLLNNLNDGDFLKKIQTEIQTDYEDESGEYGGLARQSDTQAYSLGSLLAPLALHPIPSAAQKDNRAKLELAEKILKGITDEKKRKEMEEAIAELKFSMDTEYQFSPESMIEGAGSFFQYHLHSVKGFNNDQFSGPSKPDLTSTSVHGDGLVFTRQKDPKKVDIDYYFTYPVLLSDGTTAWKEKVIDLGVYSQK